MKVADERQHRVALGLLTRFRGQLEAEQSRPPHGGLHPRIRDASVEAFRSEIRVLEAELAEYERIAAGAADSPAGSIVGRSSRSSVMKHR